MRDDNRRGAHQRKTMSNRSFETALVHGISRLDSLRSVAVSPSWSSTEPFGSPLSRAWRPYQLRPVWGSELTTCGHIIPRSSDGFLQYQAIARVICCSGRKTAKFQFTGAHHEGIPAHAFQDPESIERSVDGFIFVQYMRAGAIPVSCYTYQVFANLSHLTLRLTNFGDEYMRNPGANVDGLRTLLARLDQLKHLDLDSSSSTVWLDCDQLFSSRKTPWHRLQFFRLCGVDVEGPDLCSLIFQNMPQLRTLKLCNIEMVHGYWGDFMKLLVESSIPEGTTTGEDLRHMNRGITTKLCFEIDPQKVSHWWEVL